VKQARDQDPDAIFVRRWVPELSAVPPDLCFEPWKLGLTERRRYGLMDYPEPMVDHQRAAPEAKPVLADFRKRPGFAEQARAVQQTLGSRKPATKRRKRDGQKQLRLF
ncbi:MAG: FAD-binding domain-containing protein, partial [Wenzhouxiangella sp.]|nr:FAD-binding domain-containing protein [Wenzhouxiangella sp.]